MPHALRFILTLCALLVATAVSAQPAGKPATPAAVEAGGAAVEAGGPSGYAYDPDGRRDPFLSLIARGSAPDSVSNRPAGPQGLLIGELTVKGVVRDRSGFIAMVQGPDTKTFIIRSGQKLMDGTVKAITADSVVFSQDVSDPLSLVKQKEIRKTVRSADGGRG
jgi:hypothetical protein